MNVSTSMPVITLVRLLVIQTPSMRREWYRCNTAVMSSSSCYGHLVLLCSIQCHLLLLVTKYSDCSQLITSLTDNLSSIHSALLCSHQCHPMQLWYVTISITLSYWWRGGAIGTALNLWFIGRGFKSWPHTIA